MEAKLQGLNILIVDDEPDILSVLEEEIAEACPNCRILMAETYEWARDLLDTTPLDLVILDIMGVRGFDLLNASVHLGFPTVMLTAHAFSAADLKRAIEMGARAYIPKEKMFDIAAFLEDVLTLEHRSNLKRMFQRLGSVFNKKFGSQWMEDEKTYWEQVASGNYEPRPVILKK